MLAWAWASVLFREAQGSGRGIFLNRRLSLEFRIYAWTKDWDEKKNPIVNTLIKPFVNSQVKQFKR